MKIKIARLGKRSTIDEQAASLKAELHAVGKANPPGESGPCYNSQILHPLEEGDCGRWNLVVLQGLCHFHRFLNGGVPAEQLFHAQQLDPFESP